VWKAGDHCFLGRNDRIIALTPLTIFRGTFASRELESERRHQPSPSYSSRGCSSIKQAGLVVRNRSLSGFMIHDGSKAGLQFSQGTGDTRSRHLATAKLLVVFVSGTAGEFHIAILKEESCLLGK